MKTSLLHPKIAITDDMKFNTCERSSRVPCYADMEYSSIFTIQDCVNKFCHV